MTKIERVRDAFLKTISDKTRFGIIQCLRKGPKSVNGMKNECKLDQTLVSYHLKYLKNHGFVEYKKRGKQRIYFLDKRTISPILNALEKSIRRYYRKYRKLKRTGRSK